MTLLFILITGVFTLVSAYHLVMPFLGSRHDQIRFEALDEDLRRVEELAARKSTLLQTLGDIELDRETGKITEQDHATLKRRYEREAVEVMRKLDELHGGRGWETAIDEELDQRLERFAREREASGESAAASETIDCPSCDKQMEEAARFCSQCGHTLGDAPDETPAQKSDAAPMESHALPETGPKVAT